MALEAHFTPGELRAISELINIKIKYHQFTVILDEKKKQLATAKNQYNSSKIREQNALARANKPIVTKGKEPEGFASSFLKSTAVSIFVLLGFAMGCGIPLFMGLYVLIESLLFDFTFLNATQIDWITGSIIGVLATLLFLIVFTAFFVNMRKGKPGGTKHYNPDKVLKEELIKQQTSELLISRLEHVIRDIETKEKTEGQTLESYLMELKNNHPRIHDVIFNNRLVFSNKQNYYYPLFIDLLSLKINIKKVETLDSIINKNYLSVLEREVRNTGFSKIIPNVIQGFFKEYLEFFQLFHELILYLEVNTISFFIFKGLTRNFNEKMDSLRRMQQINELPPVNWLRERVLSSNVNVLENQQADFENLVLVAESVILSKTINKLRVDASFQQELVEEINKPLIANFGEYPTNEMKKIEEIYELATENKTQDESFLKELLSTMVIENESFDEPLFKEHVERIKNSVISKGFILETLDLNKLIEDGTDELVINYLRLIIEFITFVNENSVLSFMKESYEDIIANINNFLELFASIRQAKSEKNIRKKLSSQSDILRGQIDKTPLAKMNIKNLSSPKGYNKDSTLSSISSIEGDIIEIRTRKGTYYALHKHFEDEDSLKGKEQELLTDKELEVKLQSIGSLLEEIEQSKDLMSDEEYFEVKNQFLAEQIMVKHTLDKRKGDTKSIICPKCSKSTSSIKKTCQQCHEDLPICLICYNSISKGAEVSLCTHCETIFHTKHIKDWLQNSDQCPYCRKSLNKDIQSSILD